MGEVSAVAGEALIISCPVAGYPIHTIKWFRGKDLSNTVHIYLLINQIIWLLSVSIIIQLIYHVIFLNSIAIRFGTLDYIPIMKQFRDGI